jgi:PHD/YefM family antitoxin component YafN of YafNO toxin-antitoxin module
MKIVVSVNELASETQAVIDNMRRSKAPVMIGEGDQPVAVLLSLDEYERLQRQAQKPVATEATQPIAATQPAPAEAMPAPAEVAPVAQPSDIAQRTAAAIQADRAAPAEPKVVSQRPTTLQPDPTLAAPLRSPRPTKPLPKPPRPLDTPRTRSQFSLAAIPGGWQTIALVAGMLALGLIGFALIVNAFGG